MNTFNIYMPVNILFGKGRIHEIGTLASRFGRHAMLVTTPWIEAQKPLFEGIIENLRKENMAVTVFDQVCPNPTTDMIDEAAAIARQNQVDVIIGAGGGSSLDAAKAIAVGATHPGSVWDYVVVGPETPTGKTLPIITIPTTAGTGAHITQGAVITNTALRHKSAIVNWALFPKACIVDPDLTATLPLRAWAATGFDSMTHAMESYIHKDHIHPIDQVALKAITLIIENLPKVLADPKDEEARACMSYADTLSGISNANVGTVLPHAMGQAISGMFPKIAHGEALAVVYEAVAEFTLNDCVERYACLARLFDPALNELSDEDAAKQFPAQIAAFLSRINLRPTFKTLDIPAEALEQLSESSMHYADTYAHPRVPGVQEVRAIYEKCLG